MIDQEEQDSSKLEYRKRKLRQEKVIIYAYQFTFIRSYSLIEEILPIQQKDIIQISHPNQIKSKDMPWNEIPKLYFPNTYEANRSCPLFLFFCERNGWLRS